MGWNTDVALAVEIGFGSGPFAASPSWTAVTTDVRGLVIDRGRASIRSVFDAGTARFTLSNAAGDYSPNNTGSPHAGNMNIGTPVRIQAVHNVTTFDLFRGHVASWPVLNEQNTDLTVELFCTDNLPLINLEELDDQVYAEETTDTRIGNILDDVGWPAADRALDAGVTDAAGITETFAVYIAANVAGTFTLTISGETTSNLAFNASAATVETAVEALAGISAATVTGTGINGDPWLITIDTPFQHHTMTAAGAGLHSQTLLPARHGQFDEEHTHDFSDWMFREDEPHLFAELADNSLVVTQHGSAYRGNAWRLLRNTVTAEQGVFFIADDGNATFKNRVAFSSIASSATYGPEPADLSYTDIALLYDDDLLVNKATVTANTGGPQTASDSTSITNHGPHSIRVTSRSLLAANEALNVAEFIVGKRKDVKVRIVGFTVKPRSDPSNLWPEVLTRELQQVVTVKYDDLVGDVLNQLVAIENITHDITEDNWIVTYRCQLLSTFETQDYWILDTSQLDTATRLA